MVFTKTAYLWGIVPIPVLLVTRLPGNWLGLCLGFCILIKRDGIDHAPTIIHELEHCKQFFLSLGIGHFIFYWLSKRYRLHAEVKAFAAEIAQYPENERPHQIQEASRALAHCYGLKLSQEKAITRLGQQVTLRLAKENRSIT